MFVDELKAKGNRPRVHGNGFIQLDLPNGSRLHVWDDDIPRQSVNTSKHDHAFGFESRVICGTLINIEYEIRKSPTGFYVVHIPQRKEGTEDTKLVSTGERVVLRVVGHRKYSAGQSYKFKPLVFHDTWHNGTTATIMTKTTRLDVEPRVLVPLGQEPDNDFDRDAFDPNLLWPFIERALDLARAMEEV